MVFEDRLGNPAHCMNMRLLAIPEGSFKPFDVVDWLDNSGMSVPPSIFSAYPREVIADARSDLTWLEEIETKANQMLQLVSAKARPDTELKMRAKVILLFVSIARNLGGTGDNFHRVMRMLVMHSEQMVNISRQKKRTGPGLHKANEVNKKESSELRDRVLTLYKGMQGTRSERAIAIQIKNIIETDVHVDSIRKICRNAKRDGLIPSS